MDSVGLGGVAAVFPRRFYLASALGGLGGLGPAGLGGGPLNMLCALPDGLDWQVAGLRTGDAVSWDGGYLLAAGRFRFSLASAVAWRPTPPPVNWDGATLPPGLGLLSRLGPDPAATY